MADNGGRFTRFDPYRLTDDDTKLTGCELGCGSYARVLEVTFRGLKCAGKKIHDVLLSQGDASYTVCRFEEECRLLSQVRHPNIVQFLGVYFQQGVQVPILVMEFLPTNLTSCIEQYGILSKEISYSILHDIALGLCYLHSQTPPIIHRNLSSNNVLLTPNMTAKISDLGVARILNLTLLQVSRMTQTPGTPAFMPPEVMVANPKYNTSVDEFSYGIMMIHIFSGKWPEPQVGPNCTEPDGTMIPVSEAKRREVFFQAIENDHPLMDLILKCIHNHPQSRAHASEIVRRLAEMVLLFPASFANRLEMLRYIETASVTVVKLKKRLDHVENYVYLASKQQQPLQPSSITWEACKELPISMNSGHATVINGNVYYGGGMTKSLSKDDVADNIVFCYDPILGDPILGSWTSLPPLPVKHFSLGQINNELVATGGVQRKHKNAIQSAVYTFDERSKQWEIRIPPMPTARCIHGVLSTRSALVVAGGQVKNSSNDSDSYTNSVEVFKPDKQQWYRAMPLPVCLFNMSVALLHDTCYVIGGYRDQVLSQVYFTTVETLLNSTVCIDQTTNDLDAIWNTLPANTPNSQPASVALAGYLTSIAGTSWDTDEPQTGVYVYSPLSSTWDKIGDLPVPREICTAIEISPLEMLVIGGWTPENGDKNTVIKGRIQFLPETVS